MLPSLRPVLSSLCSTLPTRLTLPSLDSAMSSNRSASMSPHSALPSPCFALSYRRSNCRSSRLRPNRRRPSRRHPSRRPSRHSISPSDVFNYSARRVALGIAVALHGSAIVCYLATWLLGCLAAWLRGDLTSWLLGFLASWFLATWRLFVLCFFWASAVVRGYAATRLCRYVE